VKPPVFVLAFLVATAAPNSGLLATDILTNRGDNARTGLNASETILNPSNVRSSLQLIYNQPVDSQVYAQPLYVSGQQITVGGQTKVANVLYVATEHDSLYAFDAGTGALYWSISLLGPGETWVSSADVNCDDLAPDIGITATPVIDRTAGQNGTIFVLTFSKNTAGTIFVHRLHAVDLSNGNDRLTPVAVSGSVPGAGPAPRFVAKQQRSRAGLLLLGSVIYTAWASFGDNEPYAGWIIAYNESNLSQAAVLNTDPNGSPTSSFLPGGSGNGIWQAGNGPSADPNGNIYVSTANGPFDQNLAGGFPANKDYGDTVLKLSTSLSVSDYFTPFNQSSDADADLDLGSGGPVVLPDIVDKGGTHHHLLVAAGKDSNIYLLNRDSLGKFIPNSNNSQIYQELNGALPAGVWSSPAYFNGSIYYGGGGLQRPAEPIWQFTFDFTNPNKPVLGTNPASVTSINFGYPGATPTISANGTSNGILWAYENHSGAAVLHAYDATDLNTELYNSSDLNIGGAVKFAVPTVCNGKVFVGTSNSIAAFGLGVSAPTPTPTPRPTPTPPPRPSARVAKDFSGNGFADLVWEDSSKGQRLIWLMRHGAPTYPVNLGTIDPSWHIAGVGDFLGNGQSDLVWERTDGEHLIWILAGGVPQYSISLPTLSGGWHVVGAGNFNGDGKADLVWENSVTGAREIWLMNNGVPTTAIILPTVGTDWHIAGVGDFLANGQADLVWENRVTGGREIWLMNQGTPTSAIILPTVGTDWHIAGAGDFMGTGQASLVWENSLNGQRLIWVMKNGVPTTAIILPTVGTNWHIVDH
jgi:hypothetical protein